MKNVSRPIKSFDLMLDEFESVYREYFEYSHTEFSDLKRGLKILFDSSVLDSQTFNGLAENLYTYLKHKGHFRNAHKEDVVNGLVRILKYAQQHQEPLTWHTGQEDYAEQLLSLYNDIKQIGAFEGKSQITLITRIISLIYGCTPVYDNRLCAFMGIYRGNDLALYHIHAYCKILVPLLISILSILEYNIQREALPEGTITMIEEIAHAIYEDNERRKKQIAMFP